MTTTTLGNINPENKQVTGRPVPPKEASFTGQRGFRRIAVVGAAVLLAAMVVGFVPRLSQRKRAASDTNQLAIPNVSVVSPITGAPPDGLMLPAEVRPWQEASIFSRVNGYLKSWLVDIGAHVEQDQLLAEIDTPDLDHQLDQARSQATLAQGSSQLAKNTNVGDLIVANNTNMEMFHIQQTNPLRIYFRVPQANAPDIRVGRSIDVVFLDLGKTLPAKVATTSESITPNSRTLLVELHLDNPNNEIQPGSYAQVRLMQGSLGQIVTLPNNTLLFRTQGLQVGVVKPDNTVELRDIKVGRDFGTTIQIVQGVTPSDKVIVNPSDSLTTGKTVRVAAATAVSPSPNV